RGGASVRRWRVRHRHVPWIARALPPARGRARGDAPRARSGRPRDRRRAEPVVRVRRRARMARGRRPLTRAGVGALLLDRAGARAHRTLLLDHARRGLEPTLTPRALDTSVHRTLASRGTPRVRL